MIGKYKQEDDIYCGTNEVLKRELEKAQKEIFMLEKQIDILAADNDRLEKTAAMYKKGMIELIELEAKGL